MFGPDGRLAVTADAQGVSVFSIAPTGPLSRLATDPVSHPVESVAFSPNRRLLAAAGGTEGRISLFSVASDGTLSRLAGSPFIPPIGLAGTFGHTWYYLDAAAFSPNGRLPAVASYNPSVILIFAVGADGRLTQVAQQQPEIYGSPNSVTFSPVVVAVRAISAYRGYRPREQRCLCDNERRTRGEFATRFERSGSAPRR